MGDLNCNMLPSSLNNINTQALLNITDIYNLRAWKNDKCLATKHHQPLFGDQTFYRLDTLFGAV